MITAIEKKSKRKFGEKGPQQYHKRISDLNKILTVLESVSLNASLNNRNDGSEYFDASNCSVCGHYSHIFQCLKQNRFVYVASDFYVDRGK